jgi:hypothetical protein
LDETIRRLRYDFVFPSPHFEHGKAALIQPIFIKTEYTVNAQKPVGICHGTVVKGVLRVNGRKRGGQANSIIG